MASGLHQWWLSPPRLYLSTQLLRQEQKYPPLPPACFIPWKVTAALCHYISLRINKLKEFFPPSWSSTDYSLPQYFLFNSLLMSLKEITLELVVWISTEQFWRPIILHVQHEDKKKYKIEKLSGLLYGLFLSSETLFFRVLIYRYVCSETFPYFINRN